MISPFQAFKFAQMPRLLLIVAKQLKGGSHDNFAYCLNIQLLIHGEKFQHTYSY